MNLWTQDLSLLTFAHLDEFLKLKHHEGLRLDYKAQYSEDSCQKLMAAYANTIGGLIVIGIKEDTTKGEPFWRGENFQVEHLQNASDVKVLDNIQQAANRIYPPVQIQISRIIQNEAFPGKALIVVRVDQSAEAPHAIENNQEVYVVQKISSESRRAGVGVPKEKKADIDQIQRMFERREKTEIQRESMVRESRSFLFTKVTNPKTPYLWSCIIPFFPNEPVCDKITSYKNHKIREAYSQRRTPNGSFLALREEGDKIYVASEVHTSGLVSVFEQLRCPFDRGAEVDFGSVLRSFLRCLTIAQGFYSASNLYKPSYCNIQLGISGVKNHRLILRENRIIESEKPLMVDSFTTERQLTYSPSLTLPFEDILEIIGDFVYNFDSEFPRSQFLGILGSFFDNLTHKSA